MADRTSIEWTRGADGSAGATWNPIRARTPDGKVGHHCEHKSEACRFCYAERINKRLGTRLDYKPGYLKSGAVEVFLDEKKLAEPLRWRKPRNIFLGSMTDVGADFVTDDMLDKVLAVAALRPDHVFQVLSKRPDRMQRYISGARDRVGFIAFVNALRGAGKIDPEVWRYPERRPWPLPNVWLGTSVEDQPTADERIPHLVATPAAVRFISYEPALGPLNLHEYLLGFSGGHPAACSCGHGHGFDRCPNYGRVSPTCHRCDCRQFRKRHGADGLHWVIAGGESGPGARPAHPNWFRSVRDQCVAAGVAYFFKQWGEWAPDTLLDNARKRGVLLQPDGSRPTEADLPAMMAGTFDFRPWQHLSAVGKKRAGRLLDGRTWDEMPERTRG